MTGENGTPATPDWTPDSRACPFGDCDICTQLPENIFLGQE